MRLFDTNEDEAIDSPTPRNNEAKINASFLDIQPYDGAHSTTVIGWLRFVGLGLGSGLGNK